jgi:hypothetical protein
MLIVDMAFVFSYFLLLSCVHAATAYRNNVEYAAISLAERLHLTHIDVETNSAVISLLGGTKETQRYLKSSKSRNNFVGKTFYSDSECQIPFHSFGSLVNYCFDVDNAQGSSSFIIKMNKRDHTIVQLEYDGYYCKNTIPRKIINIAAGFPEFTANSDYGDCLPDGTTGKYYTVDYLSERPVFEGMYGVLALVSAANDGDCDVNEFVDFNWYKSGECVAVGERGVKFNADSCDSTGMNAPHMCKLLYELFELICALKLESFVASSWPSDSTCTVATSGTYFATFKQCTVFDASARDDDRSLAHMLFSTVCTF